MESFLYVLYSCTSLTCLKTYSKSYQTLVNMFWSDLMIFKKKSSLCWVCIIHYYYLKYPIFSVQLEGRDIIMAALTALCMLCQHLIMKVEAWMCMSLAETGNCDQYSWSEGAGQPIPTESLFLTASIKRQGFDWRK